MKQVGVDICNLPEVDGYRHVIVLIDYFSKWSEAKPTKDKSAPTIAQFLYEVMCRHGCFEIQINDQGREFVNEVCKQLHDLTGVEQRVTLLKEQKVVLLRNNKQYDRKGKKFLQIWQKSCNFKKRIGNDS